MLHHWTRGLKAVGLGLVTLAGTANAQTKDVPGPIDSLQDLQDTGRMIFKLLDANNDGQISQKEAVDAGNIAVGGLFFQADANGDGVVSQEEAKQARETFMAQKPLLRFVLQRTKNVGTQGNNGSPNPAAAIGSLLDSNNDKQLQANEARQAIQTAVQGVYATADTNRDGFLSPVEVNAAIAGAVKAAQQASFQAADADNSGQISKEEFQKALTDPANAVFQVLDANADGQLSQQELQRAGRVIENQLKQSMLPEPPNSPRHLLQSGQKPGDVAPVPNIAVPNNNSATRPASAPAPAAPPR